MKKKKMKKDEKKTKKNPQNFRKILFFDPIPSNVLSKERVVTKHYFPHFSHFSHLQSLNLA